MDFSVDFRMETAREIDAGLVNWKFIWNRSTLIFGCIEISIFKFKVFLFDQTKMHPELENFWFMNDILLLDANEIEYKAEIWIEQ